MDAVATSTSGLLHEPVTESNSDELEFQVVLRRKRTQRPAYRPACQCTGNLALVQAPPPPILRGWLTVSTVGLAAAESSSWRCPMQRISSSASRSLRAEADCERAS